ncbi:MAG: DUF1266 domain-containing protein [Oscillospiraceae bacterium]
MSFDEKSLLTRLDELFDEDKFAEIEREIRKLPREELSLELRFRLVSALNNRKKFEESMSELKEIEPLCKTPAEKARFWYNTGYAHYVNDHEMAASHCFKRAQELDPEDSAGLDLKSIIEECDGYIYRDLMELKGFGRAAVEAIHARCEEVAEKDREELSEPEFTIYLGYLPGIRVPIGLEKPLLFDDVVKKYSDDEKPIAKDFLQKYFGITDTDGFKKFYHEDMKYNLYGMAGDVLAYLDGKPRFPVSELTGTGRELFDDCSEYLNAIRECMTEPNVLGWDISEKVGMARQCYACDILSNSDFFGCMTALAQVSRERFASFEEFMISLTMGCGFFMFLDDNCSIKSAINFMNTMLPMLLRSPLAQFKWG